jgi:hypothetical protein
MVNKILNKAFRNTKRLDFSKDAKIIFALHGHQANYLICFLMDIEVFVLKAETLSHKLKK